MTILYILVPAALVVVAIAVVAFGWATRRGQFDDLETPALRMLRDDLDTSASKRPPSSDRPPSRNGPRSRNIPSP